jgi:hypothetical protein
MVARGIVENFADPEALSVEKSPKRGMPQSAQPDETVVGGPRRSVLL